MGCGSSAPHHHHGHRHDGGFRHNDHNDRRNDDRNNVNTWDNGNYNDTHESRVDGRENEGHYGEDENKLSSHEKEEENTNVIDNNYENEKHKEETLEERKPTPKPPSPKPPSPPPEDEYEEDFTPFDDDGIFDPEGYNVNSVGLLVKSVNFCTEPPFDEPDGRPYGNPDNLYVDTDFPLEIAIVQDNNGIEWKRPKEFLSNPKLFTGGTTRFDIGQGSAGTCWFLSTVANIANNDKLLKQVVPEDAYFIDDPDRYDGVFHARFYRFGQWEDVYIDDYLPVIYGNVIWGAKSSTDENELWVALLEKAFAKLHGSYDAIYGGQPGDAFLQLTGGIGERLELDDHAEKASVLFQRMKNALNSSCHVTCVVPDEYDNYKGLVGGHAYSLVGVNQVGKTKLIRVRNPWGHTEWTGPWSDGSAEWETIPENSVVAPNKDDGEFYVSLKDFMIYFSHTTICSLTPDFDSDGSSDSLNHILSLYGEWRGETAAGFHKLMQNPKFCFTVTDQGLLDDGHIPFVIQIVQKSEKRKSDHVSIRCDVLRVLGDKIDSRGRCIALEILGQKNNVYSTELQSSFRHKLKPGRYIVLPSTVDEGQEKTFLLRLFSPAPLENIKEIPRHGNIVSCDSEETLEAKGKSFELPFEKTLFGEFISNHNAGGQVSNRDSYHLNPQYLINIPNTGSDVPLVVHIMQTRVEPQYPVGFRLYNLDASTRPPLDINYLYEQYNSCPRDLDGDQSKFMISWDVDAKYLLPAGRYVGLVCLDQPNTEKPFSIVFKSSVHINIKGYQTS